MATGGDKSAGFTIIETLIVLAVSAVLATGMILIINGRQNVTQFQVAANSLKTQLEQIINETSNGYFPGNGGFSCSPGPSITGGSNNQGTNNSCIFLGKAIQFGISTGAADAPESFATYPLVANRYKADHVTEVDNFSDAHPIALSPDGGTGWPAGVDYIANFKTQNGLSLDHAQYFDASGAALSAAKNYAVFALADSLGQYAVNSKGDLNSSVQNLDLYDYDLSAAGNWPSPSFPTGSSARQLSVSKINAGIDNDPTHVIGSLQLCFSNGSPDRSARITISGQGQLSVTLKIFGTATC